MPAKCAALTITHNEPDFIRMWYAYVSDHFATGNIHILDDGSNGSYTDGLVANIHRTDHFGKGYCGDTNLRVAVTNKFIELLKSYEYVMYCDSDMFVVPDPVKYPGGLSEFLDNFKDLFVQCSGYDVLSFNEEFLDINQRPWLSQRTYWHRDWVHLCKVCIARADPVYRGGFHGSQWNPDVGSRELGKYEREDVRLIHMGWSCKELVRRRWEARKLADRYNHMWNPENAWRTVWGVANDPKFPREPIPDEWKGAL